MSTSNSTAKRTPPTVSAKTHKKVKNILAIPSNPKKAAEYILAQSEGLARPAVKLLCCSDHYSSGGYWGYSTCRGTKNVLVMQGWVLRTKADYEAEEKARAAAELKKKRAAEAKKKRDVARAKKLLEKVGGLSEVEEAAKNKAWKEYQKAVQKESAARTLKTMLKNNPELVAEVVGNSNSNVCVQPVQPKKV